MSVNALVTGLIVFRIFKVFQKVKPTSDQLTLGANNGRKLYSIISIIIESGMILFSIQLARFVVTVVQTDDADYAYQIIVCIHEILTMIIKLVMSIFLILFLVTKGITPTFILVRVSMGLSFHDETLISEAITETLNFGGLDH